MTALAPGRALRRAEDRLRARGLTGARALELLVGALRARVAGGADPDPGIAEIAAEIPLTGDWLGLAYERFFPDLFKGARGQFFTPPPIVRLLAGIAEVGPGDDVLDPTCGAGGLLAEAARRGARVAGIELDPALAELARVQVALAGGDPTRVRTADWFATAPEPAGCVLANPPFSVRIEDRAALARAGLAAPTSSDLLFCHGLADAVRPGGRAAVVLPWSVLFNARGAGARAALAAAFAPIAGLLLPEGVFRPFGGAAGRAVLLWMRRLPCAAEPVRWGALADPGYDPRSVHLKPTSEAEVDALLAGRGWTPHPTGSWRPAGTADEAGVPVGELATVRTGRATGGAVVDLADADRSTGEIVPRSAAAGGPRVAVAPGDVLLARMRPELGNVALAWPSDGALAGSPEWIVLAAEHAGYLAHALRAPTFRARLPPTTGQTRPRTTAAEVLAATVRWPGDERAARIDRIARDLRERRSRLRAELIALQAAVDGWEAGELDGAELDAALAALEDRAPVD